MSIGITKNIKNMRFLRVILQNSIDCIDVNNVVTVNCLNKTY